MSVLESVAYPAAWTRVPLGVIAPRVSEVGYGALEPLSVFLNEGVVPRSSRDDNHNQLGSDLEKYQRVLPGDLVFNKLRTWQGGFGVSAHVGVVSPAYFIGRPTGSVVPRYLHHFMRSEPVLAELTRLSKWMPPSQFDIGWDDIRNVVIALPSLDEQRRIADFLDDQVTRIDAASQSRAAQIQRIGDLASAQIEGAIDHLGKANGWRPLRRPIRRIEQGWSPQCEAVPAGPDEWGVLKVGAVRGGAFHSEQNKRLPDDLEPQTQYEVAASDLVFSRANTPALVGEAAVVPAGVRAKLILCDKLFRVELEDDVSVDYVATVAGTARSRAYFTALSSGTSGSMVNIRAEDIQGLAAPDASLAEQTCVADYARRTRGAAAAAILALTRSIDLLHEYKRSLITAAVTGDFDVTTARTGVPA